MRISYWSSDVCSSDLAVKEAYTITNNIGYAIYIDSSEYDRARISMNRNFWICPKIQISCQPVIQYGQNRSECQAMYQKLNHTLPSISKIIIKTGRASSRETVCT